MSSLTTVICIFAIIINTSKIIRTENDTQWRSRNVITRDGWTGQAEDFLFPSVVYSLCNDKLIDETKRECTIVLQENFQDEAAKGLQCTITLEQASDGIIRVKIFGSDKVIFVWAHRLGSKESDKRSLQFKTASMDMTSCTIHDTGLVLRDNKLSKSYDDGVLHDMFHIGLLTHRETFDVIVKGLQACDNENRLCVYMYDKNGTKIKGPVTL